MQTVLWSRPRLVQRSRGDTLILGGNVHNMWAINVILVMSTALLSSGAEGAAGWERSAFFKSAAVAVRRVFDRHGRIAHYSKSCSNTIAFTRSSSAVSADKGVRVVDPSAIEVSDLKAEAGESSSVKTAGIQPREQGVLQDTVNNVLHAVRGFFVDAKTGTVALWTNFQTSQDIRRRVKGGHQLTYAEHAHLERGANDRRKLLQFAVIYAVSPQTFPYIVLYAPSLLPSTFEKPHTVRAKYKRFAHERIAATLMGLSELERQLLEADAKFKGKPRKPGSRQTKAIEALEVQKQEMVKILNADCKKRAFELLQEHMVAVTTEPPALDEAQRGAGNRKQKKKGKGAKNKNTLPKACEGLPNPAIKALGKGMGLAGWRGIAPGFYVRYMLNDYVKELGRKDEVLMRQPLESLSDSDLREACNARAIDVADDGRGRDTTVLRNSLAEWLELTSTGGVANREAGSNVVFLPDRARLLGLGLNFLENARTGQRGELQRRAMLSRW